MQCVLGVVVKTAIVDGVACASRSELERAHAGQEIERSSVIIETRLGQHQPCDVGNRIARANSSDHLDVGGIGQVDGLECGLPLKTVSIDGVDREGDYLAGRIFRITGFIERFDCGLMYRFMPLLLGKVTPSDGK